MARLDLVFAAVWSLGSIAFGTVAAFDGPSITGLAAAAFGVLMLGLGASSFYKWMTEDW